MKHRLNLWVCDYFQEPVSYLLNSAHCHDIQPHFYHADCDKTCQTASVIESITAQAKTESILLFAGVCLTRALETYRSDYFQLISLNICFELLIPEKRLLDILTTGAHLFTADMLKHWEQVKQNWGFDESARRDFFAEGTSELVLITHPEIPVDLQQMEKVARELNLPWQTLTISLEHLAQQVLPKIVQWRSKIAERTKAL